MKIIGIDPGTRVTGYGLVQSEGSRIAFLDAGVLRARAGAPLEERLAKMRGELMGILERWRPDTSAVEDVFVKVNPRSALSIGHARGAFLSALGERGIAVASLAPASVKRSVAGNGRAGKDQVAKMVTTILGLTQKYPLDATDALAIAIAQALAARAQAVLKQ